MSRFFTCLAPVVALLISFPLMAQTGFIQARVTDAETGAPVQGAQISLEGTQLLALSGPDGTVNLLTAPSGRQIIAAQRIGYSTARRSIEVPPGERLVLNIALSQEATQLSGITVVAQQGGYSANRSTTATKMDIPLIETPQAISIVTSVQIRDQGSPNLQEVLRYSTGVRNELYGIDNRGDWVSLRGSHESTTLLDGLRLPLTGWYGVVRTEPFAYERIEVLRGPSSIIAGQNDPGGVVNLVSKRPRAETTREIGVGYGNFDRKELRADLTGPLDADGSLLYRLVAIGRDGGTQIQHADEKRGLIAPSLTWRGPAGSLTLFGEHQYDRSKNTNAFLGLAGTLQEAPNGSIPTDLFIGEPDWDRYGGTRNRFGYSGSIGLGGAWQLRNSIRHDQVAGLMQSMYAAWWTGFLNEAGMPQEDGRYMGREWYIYDDESSLTAGELLLQGDARTGPVRHTLLFGVDGYLQDMTQISASGQATPLDVYTPVYGTFGLPTMDDASTSSTDMQSVGILVQDHMRVSDRLSIRAGLRRDRVRNEVTGGAVTTDWATTGNVGVVVEVVPGLAPYASYSESFSPVGGTNAAGEAFKPKRGEQIEGGVKWEPAAVPVQAIASVYSIKERNRLANDPDNINESIQIGEGTVKGAEVEVKAGVASWNLIAGYGYTQARASAGAFGGDLNPDEQLEGIPEHTASFWGVRDFGGLIPGFSLGGGARYVGRIGDGTGNVFVPEVTLFDAMASYGRSNWRIAVNANNLTDRSYIATCLARGDCWFGSRRGVTASMSFNW